MGVNKYSSTLASCNMKTCYHRKKRGVKKYMKIHNCFASTQLRITRLRKYPIDPKAYLGRCTCFVTMYMIGYSERLDEYGRER